jgi:hypothetical protein
MRHAPLAVALAAALLSCACSTAPKPCPDQSPGIARDRCYADQIATLGPDQRAEAQSAARAISDPLIQSEAVIRWIGANAGSLQPPAGQELCNLIDAADRDTCTRRLNSPHLQR